MPILATWSDLERELGGEVRWDWRLVVYRQMAELRFTPREMETAMWLFRGETNAEIGYRMGISDQTIKTYLTSVYRKGGVSSREQLILRLLGILEPTIESEEQQWQHAQS